MEKIVNKIFNSPLEIGLRLLFILNNTNKHGLDIERLLYYNYLVIHSSDVSPNVESLHPSFPNRSCEILISRDIISKGLKLLLSKSLICVDYNKNGLKYKKNDNTQKFLTYFESTYSKELDEKAKWACETFDEISDKKLKDYMEGQLGKWGSEFSVEYRVMGEDSA